MPLPRTVNLDLVRLPYTLTRSVRQARRVLKEAHADALVGFGGYVSIPAYLAARMLGVPVVVHEANKLPGIANKVGARFAAYVATTFPETTMRGSRLIGLPMKRSITHPDAEPGRGPRGVRPRPRAADAALQAGRFSQGAVSINAAVDEARERILAAGIQILHVLGLKNFTDADTVVQHASGAAYVPVPYVSDMAHAYAAADLMLGRAGAGTVMETAVSGLPVIFRAAAVGQRGAGPQRRGARGGERRVAGRGLLPDPG